MQGHEQGAKGVCLRGGLPLLLLLLCTLCGSPLSSRSFLLLPGLLSPLLLLFLSANMHSYI